MEALTKSSLYMKLPGVFLTSLAHERLAHCIAAVVDREVEKAQTTKV